MQAATIYPDWQVIVYYDGSVPEQIITDIKNEGAIAVDMTGGIYGMFWRFYAADLEDCERVIFRDADSRLSTREKLAVDEWINNDDAIHIMRDHPHHQANDENHFKILGGMWGIRGNLLSMHELVASFAGQNELAYGSDQYFLNEIYSRFQNSATIHDDFFDKKPFPTQREGWGFIGQKINENDEPFNDDGLVIRDFYEKQTIISHIKSKVKSLFRLVLKK